MAFLRTSARDRALVLTNADTTGHLYCAALETASSDYLLARNEPDTHLFHRFDDSYEAFFDQRGSKYRNQRQGRPETLAAPYGKQRLSKCGRSIWLRLNK